MSALLGLVLTASCQQQRSQEQVQVAEAAPLIPRALLFGQGTKSDPRISPDGQRIAYLAPLDGVQNVWVAPSDDLSQARAVTRETRRPVFGYPSYYWSMDSKRILYVHDEGGTEDYHLIGVDVETGEKRNYTPFESVRVRLLKLSPRHPTKVLLSHNQRDPQWADIYLLDLETGTMEMRYQNTGLNRPVADADLMVRFAKRTEAGNARTLMVIDEHGDAQPILEFAPADSFTATVEAIPPGGEDFYMLSSLNRDKAALIRYDAQTGDQLEVLFEHPKADIGEPLINPMTEEVEAVPVNYIRPEWTAFTAETAADIAAIEQATEGVWSVLSRSLDGTRWTLRVDAITAPPAFYLYTRETGALTPLFSQIPELVGAELAPMTGHEIVSRDGLTLVSYLTLPPGIETTADGKTASPLPLVLLVHGGPWGRDELGFNVLHQWLANRGYAALSVNYRASLGFGKAFVSAGDFEFGGKQLNDLIDGVNWAIDQGVADPDRIGIMGTSFGGYNTLLGMTFTPDVFACGVNIVGLSELIAFYDKMPAYWTDIRAEYVGRMGDPDTAEGRTQLLKGSPMRLVDQAKAPLLVGHGENDPRVDISQSEMIVEAWQQQGLPVTFVTYSDEGHGFRRKPNQVSFHAVAEAFFADCLGGRAEPFGSDLKGETTMTVRAGADHIPGLPQALAERASPGPQ
ncbi:MAG: S9 family peptidase [Henriciella sp.]|nr:S9 family peptidase [Henriciella sp.]